MGMKFKILSQSNKENGNYLKITKETKHGDFYEVEAPRIAENPSYEKLENSLGLHYHFWMKGDKTAGVSSAALESSELFYVSPRTKNFELDNSCNPDMDKHGFPYYLQCISGQLPNLHIPRQ